MIKLHKPYKHNFASIMAVLSIAAAFVYLARTPTEAIGKAFIVPVQANPMFVFYLILTILVVMVITGMGYIHVAMRR